MEGPFMTNDRTTLPASSGADNFPDFHSSRLSVQELAAQQGVSPVSNLDDLRGTFWPESEDLADLTIAIRQWRREE